MRPRLDLPGHLSAAVARIGLSRLRLAASLLLIALLLLQPAAATQAGPLAAPIDEGAFAGRPGRETYRIGRAVVSADSFARAADGAIVAEGAVELGRAMPAGVSAATLSASGDLTALVLEAGPFSVRFLDIARQRGDLVAAHAVVTAPASWKSAPRVLDGPIAVPQVGDSLALELPDMRVAGNAGLTVTGLTTTLAAEAAGAQLSMPTGHLRVALSPFVTEAPVSGSFDAEGGFSAVLPQLEVRLAGGTFLTEQVGISAEGLSAATASLRLPARLGASGDVPLPGFQLDSSGIRMSPTNRVDLGAVTMGLGHRNGLPFRQISATLLPDERTGHKLTLEGVATIALNGATTETSGQMVLFNNGVILAQTGGFSANLVGAFRVVASEARVEADGRLRADEADLVAPASVGGLSLKVYNVLYRHHSDPRQQQLSIGGGGFQLPPLDFGDFKMNLGAGLGKDADGYYFFEINGGFELPNLPKPPFGCTGIEVAGRIIGKFDLAMIEVGAPAYVADYRAELEVHQGYANKVELAQGGIPGIYLEKAKLVLKCKIPIPKTSFSISGFGGEISVSPRDLSFGVSLEISNDVELPMVGSILSVNGGGRIGYFPALRYELSGGVKVFTLDVLQGSAAIEYNFLTQIPRVRAAITLQNIFMQGQGEVQSWITPADNQYYLTIRGRVNIGFKRGNWGFMGLPWWDISLASAEVQGGRFKNGRWGFRADASFMWWRVGVYIDERNRMVINPGNDYTLATPNLVANARQRWLAAKGPAATDADLARVDRRFAFSGEELRVNVDQTVSLTRPSELIFALTHESLAPGSPYGPDDRFLSLVGPDGTLYQPTDPANYGDVVRYTSSITASQGLTTTTYADGTVFELFQVPEATGSWQVSLPNGFVTSGISYTLDVYQRPLPAQASAPSVTRSGADAEVGLTLDASGPVTVTVYLTPSPQGAQLAAAEVVSGSVELASFAAGPTSGPQQVTHPVSLAGMPSGDYRFSLVVDDGFNPLATLVAPETVTVDNGAVWPRSWTPEISATVGVQSVEIEWSPLEHPDLKEYNIYVSDTPGRANPAGYGDEAFNGVLGFTEVFTNGFDLHTGFEGLSPGFPYYFAIEAVNGHDGRRLLSQEFEVLPDTAPFTVSPQRARVEVTAGGSATVSFSFETALDPYPDAVGLYYNCSALAGRYQVFLPLLGAAQGGGGVRPALCSDSDPFELYLLLDHEDEMIVPTPAGSAYEIEVVAGITDPDTGEVLLAMEPGTYIIPIEAWGGGEQRLITLEVVVLPASPGVQVAPPRLEGVRI